MNDLHKVGDDLSFVREAVARIEPAYGSPWIYVLWGVICCAGMPLFDIDPHAGGVFWAIAGPLGGVASFLLGWRWSRRVGIESRELGRRHALHWTATTVAIFALVPLVETGAMPHASLGRIILLLIAFSYFIAGIYLDRPMLWIGLLTLACYVAMFFVTSYIWTVTGLAIGGGLWLSAAIGARRGPTVA